MTTANIFISVVVFVYGVVLGSFFNVVGLRWVEDKKVNGRSACPHCNATLKPINLIPIISYTIQLGKCHNCKTKISPIYPIMEITTGIAYLGAFLVHDLGLMFIASVIFLTSLLVSAVTDYKDGYVLDKVVIIPNLISIILVLIYDINLWPQVLTGIIIMLLLLIPVKMGKLGDGDVILMGMSFVMFGWLYGTVVMLIASFTAMIFMGLSKSREVRFIPFWAIGNIITYYLYLISIIYG